MKKFLSIVLALVLMLTYTMSAFAAGLTDTTSTTVIQNGYKIETLENSKEHQKIKLTNLKTDEVEYAESFLKNDKYVYSATTKEGKSTIEPVNGTVKITNENTKEVKYSKPVVTSNTTVKKSTVTPLIAGWDAYGPIRYSSYAIDTTYASVLAGCLASIYGGPITGVLVTIAGAFIALHTPDVWYIETNYVDSYDDTHFMVKTQYYAYPDYTNYQGESDFIYWT